MMENRMDNKLASGLDVEDSLIGDSTVREMLELVYDGDQSNSRRNDGSPLRPWVGVDTSGLSDAEMSNTVDNIYIEDESVFNMKKTLNNSHFDDGTIESHENEDHVLPPKTRTQHQSQKQQVDNIPNTQHPSYHQSQPRKTLSPPHRQPQRIPPTQLNIPHGDRDVGNGETATKEPANIPGFIFVTDGHPSIIHTGAELKADKKQSNNYTEKGKPERAAKARCFPRSLIICLTLFFIIASTAIAVLVYRINSESSEFASSSSQGQNDGDGLPFSSPNDPPTFEPSSSLRATTRPQVISGAPTSSPVTDELQTTTNPEPSLVLDTDTELPTKVPPTPSPSLPRSPSPTISIFFPPLFEEDVIENEPTPSPTIPEDATPTSLVAVTDAPTIWTSFTTRDPCIATVATDKDCYKNGDDIQISFGNCEPLATDWIGIYPVRQGVANLRPSRTWIWTCGDQLCNNPVASGNVTIYDLYDASGFASYRALLLRDEGNRFGGYAAYAIGNPFTISSNCNE
jgi:hypothetical protein